MDTCRGLQDQLAHLPCGSAAPARPGWGLGRRRRRSEASLGRPRRPPSPYPDPGCTRSGLGPRPEGSQNANYNDFFSLCGDFFWGRDFSSSYALPRALSGAQGPQAPQSERSPWDLSPGTWDPSPEPEPGWESGFSPPRSATSWLSAVTVLKLVCSRWRWLPRLWTLAGLDPWDLSLSTDS